MLREHARARGGARPLRRRLGRGPGRPDADPVRDSRGTPTGSRSPRTSTCSRPPGACPTCTTSASTGSTSRRCSRPSPAARTGTTSSPTTGSTPRAAARRGSPRCRPRPAGSAWACWSTSSPTTSASRPRSSNAWWWDLLQHGQASAARRGLRRRLGRRRRADPDPGRRRRRPGARRRTDREPRGRARASCATTTTASRSRPARRDRSTTELTPGGARPPALRAGELAGRRRRAQLPAVLRGQHARRRPGRGPRGASTSRTSRSGAGSTRAWSTGSGSTTPTGCATRAGYLDDLAGADRRRLRAGREDPRARRGPADVLGHRRHHRVRRPRPGRPGAHRPGGPASRSTPSRPGCAAPRSTGTQLMHDTKRAVADGILGSEVRRIARERSAATAVGLSRPRDRPRDRLSTRSPSCWPASRSTAPTCPRDASTSTRPSPAARAHRPDLAATLDVLRPGARPTRRPPAALRFQQTSGMVMAKGVEDCAFYRWSRLTSLNEVGGDPSDLRDRRRPSSTTRWPPARPTGRTR